MRTTWKALGRYGTVGLELILSIIIGFYCGKWVDPYVGGYGYATIVGTLIGVYAGFRALFYVAKRAKEDIEQAEDEESKIFYGKDKKE